MNAASPYPWLTVDEYLQFEETADTKHEYLDGILYAMVGASSRHNRLVRNLVRRLADASDGTTCEVFFSDLKLRIGESLFYYPDIMVVCDPTDSHPLYQTRSCVVVEVISPSTQMTDRREKLFAYRQIASLQAYTIVFQDEARVQRHFRDDNGLWQNAEVSGRGNVPFPCLDVTLTLEDIYRNIDFTS